MEQILVRDDGWWSLTAIAQCHNRAAADFLRLRSTQDFIDRLQREIGAPALQVVKGGVQQGTWAHPTLGLRCLAWISPEDEFLIYRTINPQDFLARKNHGGSVAGT